AAGRVDRPGPGRQIPAQEFAEVALADEADAGGVLLGRGGQPRLAGDLPDPALVQLAERKAGGGKLLLAELVEEVALVLGAIERAQRQVAPAASRRARVVAGGDGVRAQRTGGIEEMAELDLAVAQHVRVRRAPGGVLGQEVLEHPVPVLAGE